MAAGSSRQATIYDAGAAHVEFLGSPRAEDVLLTQNPPAEFNATVNAFGKDATLTAGTTLFYDNLPSVIAGGRDWFHRQFPYWYSGNAFAGNADKEWRDDAGPQDAGLASAWDILKDQKYGDLGIDIGAGFRYLLARASSQSPNPKGWLLDCEMACGSDRRRFMPIFSNPASLSCQSWKWQDGNGGLVTFLPSVLSEKLPWSNPTGGETWSSGWAGLSQLEWGTPLRIGPTGLLYARVRLLQNGRPKAGKSFTVTVSGGGTSATGTIELVSNQGFLWKNEWTPPSVSAWDGEALVGVQAVQINAKSEYAVFAITGTPGRTVSVLVTPGTATSLDVSTSAQALVPSPWRVSSYSRFPPAVQGGSVSVYKGNSLVYQGSANPAANESSNAAYYRQWASVSGADSSGVYFVVAQKTGEFQAYFKEFMSCVVDKTSPLAGCTAPNDIFANEAIPEPQVYMSEPNGTVPASPVFMKANGESGGDQRRIAPSGAGTYKVIPAASDRTSLFLDRAGNVSPYVPEFDFKIVATPAGNLRGARPTLTIIPAIRPYRARARRTDEKVESVLLKFDRKVTGADVGQCKLYRTTLNEYDNVITEPISGMTMSPVSGYAGFWWSIAIPSGDQVPRSFFVLEYDPTINLPNQATATQTDDKTPKEDCLLAARVSWMIAESNEPVNAVDVSRYTRAIGSVPTVSGSYSVDQDEGIVRLTAVSAGDGKSGLGLYRYGKGVFTPSVPKPTSPPSDCSFFGLTTTIDPCPPKTLTLCKSPRAAQAHDSLIRCDTPITKWTITPPEIAQQKIDVPIVSPYFFGSFTAAAQRAIGVKLISDPVEVTTTIDGVAVPQNEWRAWKEVENEVNPYGWGIQLALGYSSSYNFLAPPLDINIKASVIKASVSVSRSVATYTALETATLSPLTVSVAVEVFATETISREEQLDEETGQVAIPELEPREYKVVYRYTGGLTLTKEQEESLADGELLDLTIDDPTGLSQAGGLVGWKISAN